MPLNDLTADMLTRIRNAVSNRARQVMVLDNKLNRGVAKVLHEEGYIRGFETIADGRGGLIRLDLKYGPDGSSVIQSIDRVSKAGRRVYTGVDDLPKPLQGLGIVIVTTSQGVMSDRACRTARLGGEVVAQVC
ncbi:MAG: 30S ribosomal protein S8 [Phycisphaerales bacterium]|jgi:small subunit ribosomal protein S8